MGTLPFDKEAMEKIREEAWDRVKTASITNLQQSIEASEKAEKAAVTKVEQLLGQAGVAAMVKELETASYSRRCEIMANLYMGGENRPGMTLLEISALTGKADSTISRNIRTHQRNIGDTVSRDEEFLRQVAQHTINMYEATEATNELVEKELNTAVRYKQRGYANYVNGLLLNLKGNRELQAKLLRLLDPKIEVTVRTERALKQQEALLRALSEMEPEVAEKVLALAEKFLSEDGPDEEQAGGKTLA